MKVLIASSSPVARPLIAALISNNKHEFCGLITNPDKATGRGLQIEANELAHWAVAEKISLYKPSSNEDLKTDLLSISPDLVITIAYGKLIPQELLQLPKFGWINVHFSKLPRWRGAAPVQWAILSGDKTSGITVFQLDKGMDTGPIFAQESISIDPSWRSFELLAHLAALGPEVVKRSFEMIESGKASHAQVGVASIAPKISKAEAQINFDHEATHVANAIRAFTYEPGAWTLWKGEPFKICSVKASDGVVGKPGELSVLDKSVFVGTGLGVLELLRVTPAGKKEMDAIDWARGARLTGGEIFG